MDATIDIVMVTHNNLGRVIKAVDCVYKFTKNFRLFLVDDGDDLTREYFNRFKEDNFIYLRSDKAFREYNEALNFGLEHAESEYVVNLTNTADVEPNWLFPLVHLAQSNPEVGIVQPCHLFPITGVVENAGMMFREPMMHHQNMGVGDAAHRHSYVREVDGAGFCAVLLRRKEVYPFETGFYIGFQGFDDMDACMMLKKKKGLKTFYCGYSFVYHHAFASRGTPETWDEQRWKFYDENRFRFLTRWCHWGEFAIEKE